MSRVFGLFFWLLIIFGGELEAQHYIRTKDFNDLKRFFRYDTKRLPLVSAHRGGIVDSLPENSLEAFEFTISKTPAIIECDIALTKDNHLVLMHDNTLDRTSSGSGKVEDYTRAELANLVLKDKKGQLTTFRIPTLDEVLQWAKGKAILTLDIKKGVPAQMIVEAIKKHQAEKYALVITYNLNSAKEYYLLHPNLMLSVSLNKLEQITDYQQAKIPFENLVAFTGVTKLNQELIKALHKKKVYCMLGTMYEIDRKAQSDKGLIYQELIEKGIDILATDQPVLAAQSLKKYWKKLGWRKRYFYQR
jgi:glycerophosphoryl diester phosphodiesterase